MAGVDPRDVACDDDVVKKASKAVLNDAGMCDGIANVDEAPCSISSASRRYLDQISRGK